MRARDTFYYMLTALLSLFPKVETKRRIFDIETWDWLKKEGAIVAITTLGVLVIINIILAALAGRLLPDGLETTRNYFEDWPNLINYFILCPAYVVFAISFITHSRKIGKKLFAVDALKQIGLEFNKNTYRNWESLYFAIPTLITLVAIAFYSSEIDEYSYQFWFRMGESRFEKALHYYYIFYTIVLLFIVLTAASFHLEIFRIAKSFGKAVKKYVAQNRKDTSKSFDDLPAELFDANKLGDIFNPYVSLYTTSKILIIIILANMYTWKAQSPEFWGMLDVTIVALSVLGAAVVSYPRYHIQFWLFKAWQAKDVDAYPDIRKSLARGFAGFADLIILGTAMTNLVLYVLKKANIDFELLDFLK